MEKLKNLLRKNRFLFSILSKTYANVVRPIKTGFVWFYLGYLFSIKRKEVKKLKGMGFTHISQFKIKSWRIGKGKDKAYRRYYLADYKGQRCFIKVAKNDSTIVNEIRICNYLKTETLDFVPKLILAQEGADVDILAVAYIEGAKDLTCPETYEKFELFCRQIINILAELNRCSVVHADIHKGNLVYDKDDKIIVLDFGISVCKKVKNDVNYIARPGTFFIESNQSRKYDDAYSFVKMIDLWNISEEWKNSDAYKKIVDLIGFNYEEIILNYEKGK